MKRIYTTIEDTYNYYEVRNYVNDVNQENTQVLQIYDDEMKARETYTYGNERLSYTNEKTKDEYQYLTDARGSVTGMMQDGEVASSNSYSVFGTPEEVDETGNPYGYTGEAQDVTGYNYLRARYYDSQSGTFLTQDSYEGEEDNPLSQNGYTYVENNPINYTDPTGHKKSFWQKAWSSVKKTAKKVVNTVKSVAKKVVNTVKKVASAVYNTAKKVVSTVWGGVKKAASYVYNGVRNTYTAVRNYVSGGGSGRTTYYSPTYYGGSSLGNYLNVSRAPSGYSYMTYAQQVAAQTAYRQQQLTSQYQKATGSKDKPKTKEGQNLLRNWGKALQNILTKFCKTSPKAEKQKKKKAKIIEVKLPTSRGEILRDYHWSTNSNMYVHNKTGIPSPEVTTLYNLLLAEEHAPKKNPQIAFYTKMLQTGKHPITGKNISDAERANAKIMVWGLAVQPIAGAVAVSKLPQGNTSVVNKGKTTDIPKSYLYEAMKQQKLNKVPKNLKQKWTVSGYNYEVRIHPGNSAHTNADSIYRVSRKATPIPGKQGSGTEYMDINGNWWHEGVLKEFYKDGKRNPSFNPEAAKNTHIPVDK